MIHITHETSADVAAREALLDRVMPDRFLKPSERLRRGLLPARGLSLVARNDDDFVGTVRLWNVVAGGRPALLLGPLAVSPEARGNGVGTELMQAALAEAKKLGHPAVILVGDPEFYERFGFTADRTTGLIMPAPVERRRLLALELARGGLSRAKGRVFAVGEQQKRLALPTRFKALQRAA